MVETRKDDRMLLLARLRRVGCSGDEVSFWKSAGTVRGANGGSAVEFSGEAKVLYPAWVKRTAAIYSSTSSVVEFGVVMGHEIRVLGSSRVDRSVLDLSRNLAAELPRDPMRGGGPPGLRSNFRTPVAVRKTKPRSSRPAA
jgi:hypothetical protein